MFTAWAKWRPDLETAFAAGQLLLFAPEITGLDADMAEPADERGLRGMIPAAGDGSVPANDAVRRALQAVRSHLGMEVAYVSEFVEGRSVFREVDAPGREALIKVGDSYSLDDVYCRHILEGRLPELIPDTAVDPFVMAIPMTRAVPIGSHMSVPLKRANGSPFGMFCCLSTQPDRTLNERDVGMMRAFADFAAFEINRQIESTGAAEEKRARIQKVMDSGQVSVVYQPIWNVETRRPLGVECLARFGATPLRTPDRWFAEAAEAGLGVELELTTIRSALAALGTFPDYAYLSVNASPKTILDEAFHGVLDGLPMNRIVLEITEHAPVEDYDLLLGTVRPFREAGLRLAVDDAGAGYSSLQHILNLRPDLIKLDMGLTRNIDLDPARRALASALIGFARDTGSRIIAEGVETASELKVLRTLGVQKAQGYLLGRPLPLNDAKALFRTEAQTLLVA